MNATEDRITVYDGNCNFCQRVISTLSKQKWIDATKAEAYYDMSPDKQAKIDLPHFRSEMAVIDMNGGPTLYGLEGVLYAMGYRLPVLREVKRDTFLFPILNFIYKNVAWNRYIILTPKSTIKCDCEPPLNKFYRLSLFTICALASMTISALFGIVVGGLKYHLFYGSDMMVMSAGITLAMVGTGWLLQIILARLILRGEQFYDYLGHLGIIMLVGVLVLLPSIALCWLPTNVFIYVSLLNVIISTIAMLTMHYKRTKAIGLKLWWTITWLVFLYGGAIFWLFFIVNLPIML